MTVIRTDVIRGPETQAHGELRGRVEIEFGDGRVVRRKLCAPDSTAWNARLTTIGDEELAKATKDDGAGQVDPDEPITARRYATQKERAVGYLRAAMRSDHPNRARRIFEQFETYRNSKGWSYVQTRNQLRGHAGMSDEEWEEMRPHIVYMTDAGRVTTMQDHKLIENYWDAR